MKAKWFLPAALLLLAVSCTVKESEQAAMMTDASKITATVGSNGPSTKVSMTESDGQTRQTFWEKGDEIAVFYHSGRPLEYALEGEGGESSGVFSYAGGVGGGLEFPGFYGLYPYDANAGVAGSVMSVTFPATQTYREGAFDAKANIMVAASGTNELFFRNVGGYLVLQFYGEDAEVKSITVTGNCSEALAGPAEVWVDEDEAPEIDFARETAEMAVTLVCATPVKVGATADEATEFWFVLPPMELEEGFTVSVEWTGGTFSTSLEESFDIIRSQVQRMDPLELVEEEEDPYNGHDYVEMGPNGLKWATCNVGAETPEDYGDYFAWGEIETKSNYTWSTYKWIETPAGMEVAAVELWKFISKYTFEDSNTAAHWYEKNGEDEETGEAIYKFVGDGVTDLGDPEYNYADDAARKNWGGNWRIPTTEEWRWLRENCRWIPVTEETEDGGLKLVGVTVRNDDTGNEIFLPLAGFWRDESVQNAGVDGGCWSATLYERRSYDGLAMCFGTSTIPDTPKYYAYFCTTNRYMGCSVRPVSE